MSDVKDRLNEYIKVKNITVREFERGANLSNGYVSSIRRSIGRDSLDKILEQYPDLNRDWLLYGEGEMLKKANTSTMTTRFIEAKEYLQKRYFLTTDAQIADKLGTNRSYISELSNDKRNLTPRFIDKIVYIFPELSKDWLLTGEGDMLNPVQSNSNAEETLPAGWMNVPVVPVTAQAGYPNGYGDAEYIDSLDRMPFPVDRQYKGRYICFEVRGDSMDDGTSQSIIDGDFVLAREIGRTLWEDYKLHFNKWLAFVIVTREEGIMIKQIIDHDVANHIITLHSLNPLFHDYQVSLENVLEIYNVVQVTRKHR